MRARLIRTAGATMVVALVAGAACSKSSGAGTGGGPSSRPSSTAKLEILEPNNGQVIHGSSVHLEISLEGAKIVPATTTNLRPDQGHIHVLLDGTLVSMTFGLSQDIPSVPPGMHVLRVEFVASDHAPFDPRVFKEVTFEVKS